MAAIGLPTPASGNGSSVGALGGGRVTELVTALLIVGSWLVAVLSHVGAFGWHSDQLTDLFAILAVGATFGRASGIGAAASAAAGVLTQTQAAALDTLNTNTRALVERANLNTDLAQAAHVRLDSIHAPAAPVDHRNLTVGDVSAGVTAPVGKS